MDRSKEISRFYDILGKLEKQIGGKRMLTDCSKGTGWPNRGVYFFFEAGENRSVSGVGPRVVRVGTHGLKMGAHSTFWQRLSQHRGKERGGNHRGSIFRSLVGEALKGEGQNMEPVSWGIGSDPGKAAAKLGVSRPEIIDRERELEVRVSLYISRMPILWLPIEDEPGPKSSRGYIERNTIALLSNYAGDAVDTPSANWLGRFSSRERVRQSGLWNNNHVDEKHEIDFLNRYAQLVSQV